jgi:hypothetical protein
MQEPLNKIKIAPKEVTVPNAVTDPKEENVPTALKDLKDPPANIKNL